MVRRTLPAPGNKLVRTALDSVRVSLREIGEWLRQATQTGKPVSAATLNNYRNGRREMPTAMQRLLAQQLRKQADQLRVIANKLESVDS